MPVTPEELIGRLEAIETVIGMMIADRIAASPIPMHTALEVRQAFVTIATTKQTEAQRMGQSTEALVRAHAAGAIFDIGQTALQTAGAATADAGGVRN